MFCFVSERKWEYLVRLARLTGHPIMPTLTPCVSYAHQVEEARPAESPAPWIADRRSDAIKVVLLLLFFCFVVLFASPSYGDNRHLLMWVHWRVSTLFLFYTSDIIIHLCYSVMAPLIAEYDRHMDEMTQQLQRYQVKNTETMRHKFTVDSTMKYCTNSQTFNILTTETL